MQIGSMPGQVRKEANDWDFSPEGLFNVLKNEKISDDN